MVPFGGKPPALLKETDLQTLVDDRVLERRTLEFKRDLPTTQRRDKLEFLKDTSSLANTSGGYLIYGIEESSGIATQLVGVDPADAGKRVTGLQDSMRQAIRPRILDVEVELIPLANGDVVAVFHLPMSPQRPHMITLENHSKFYARDTNGKYQLDVDQLRHAFIGSAREDVLEALITELRINAALESTVMYFGVPYERDALQQALRFVADLPDPLRAAIEDVAARIAKFNALVASTPGRSDYGMRNNELRSLARENQPIFEAVTDQIEAFLRPR